MQNLSQLSFGTDCYGTAVVISKLLQRMTTDVGSKERFKAILSKMKNGRVALKDGIEELRDVLSKRRLREVSRAINEMAGGGTLRVIPTSTGLNQLLRSKPDLNIVNEVIKKANQKNALPRWFHFLLKYGLVQAKSSFNVVISELEVSITVEKESFKDEEFLVKCVRCVKNPQPSCEFCERGKIVKNKTRTRQKQETQSRRLKKILGSPTGIDQKLLNGLTQAAGSQVKCDTHKNDTKICEFESEVKDIFSDELEKLGKNSTNVSLKSSVIVIPVYELTMSNTVDRATFLICGSNYMVRLKNRRKLSATNSRKSSLISAFRPSLSFNLTFPLKAKEKEKKVTDKHP
ncbi:Oidioi.mRNA.OKI2018_I69.XSR.g15263.t1.cds [Oikopleura dioica]|uniref:Oidioi.mRNA.OKI2018_I69.XSR.g15263.t1.cds n=1 Tax=Oikopleura dioica TaxID=34765 RepID=A0ABN7SHG0_OIKDI|nr:Oidioi.mRNA.OKI2018_I69.XSR.g15263.t1.cds [Oikopleura dioica]